ncbi:MAG TPA: PadR family transcriptional regulator [Dietzia timorensis]|uniref:PadR family transcriptional regulator n=1 Tax=Dietzia timorensis TaxID=499555 RepID=A0A921F2Y6_9ACTN|nr:PadR family transcriptional regulator [Dietzia timorensis]HJE89618.1 PadR family transcriptional regulator [Dietzia timorensis]
MLDLAVLGLLDEGPMHGYELRKRLSEVYGTVRTVSFGSLYPTLRKLHGAGLIEAAPTSSSGKTRVPTAGRGKNKKPYRLTDAGRAELAAMLAEPSAASFTDDGFGVHLALFDRTPASARLRVLEGRRRVLEARREEQRGAAGTTQHSEISRYTRQFTLLGLETSERELRWINELIAAEQTRNNPSQNA